MFAIGPSTTVCVLSTAADTSTGRTLLQVEPKFFRRVESHRLVGDSSKARHLLGWRPLKAGSEVAKILTRAEIDALRS